MSRYTISKLIEEGNVLTDHTSKEHTVVADELALVIRGWQDVVKCETKQLSIARLDQRLGLFWWDDSGFDCIKMETIEHLGLLVHPHIAWLYLLINIESSVNCSTYHFSYRYSV